MTDPVIDFYDTLSPFYKENMGWDWEDGLKREAKVLTEFLNRRMESDGPYKLLDCTCGTGTQAIGLALHGHTVHATDLSPGSIEEAAKEASVLGAEMTFGVASYFSLEDSISDTFDVVLSCDNSIAHCVEDGNLCTAFSSMKTRLTPGGLVLISLRDYAPLVEEKPRFTSTHVEDRPDGRRLAFQVWDWEDGDKTYRNHQFLIKETDGEYNVRHFETRLRALRRDEMLAAMDHAGYKDIRWHTPEESGYYQPIVTAYNK